MPQDATSLTALIEKSRLVNPNEMEEVRQLAAEQPEGQVFLKELVARGVLTHWQAGQIFLGNTSFFLGKYKLIELLGAGGMGRVFRAEHVTMNRRVAIKIIGRDLMKDETAKEQFLNEARAIAALNHPHIVHAYSIEKEGDRYYIVMEFVDGLSLDQMVNRQGSLPEDRAAIYVLQVAQALAHAHGHNMIHCDIKPANLLVNEQDQIKVLDMGMVRLYNSEEKTSESGTKSGNEFIGTVDYMAPEVADSIDNASPVSDLYSLGCVFYFLLTGCVPFPGASLPERILKHQTEDPIDPRILNPRLSQGISEICLKMMAREVLDRYQSAQEVVDVLSQWCADLEDTQDDVTSAPFDFARDAIPSSRPGGAHSEMDFLENGMRAPGAGGGAGAAVPPGMSQAVPPGMPMPTVPGAPNVQAMPGMPGVPEFSAKSKKKSQSGMFAPDGSLMLDAADAPRKKRSDSSIVVFPEAGGKPAKTDSANQPRVIKKNKKDENVGDLFGESAGSGSAGGKRGNSSIGNPNAQDEGEESQLSGKKSSNSTMIIVLVGVAALAVVCFLLFHGNLTPSKHVAGPAKPGTKKPIDEGLTDLPPAPENEGEAGTTGTTETTGTPETTETATQPTESEFAQPEGLEKKEPAVSEEVPVEKKPDATSQETGKPAATAEGDKDASTAKPKDDGSKTDDPGILKDDEEEDSGGFKLDAGFDDQKAPEPPKEPAKKEPKPEVKIDKAEEDRVNQEEEAARKADEALIAEDVKKIEAGKKVGNPFEKLPRAVSLQNQAKNQQLVKINSAALPWKLALFGGDKAQTAGRGGKQPPEFTLKAVDESKPEEAKWQVMQADKAIAELWREDNALCFKWAEGENGKPKPFKALGNCMLKIDCNGKTHKLLLREPSEITMPTLDVAKGKLNSGKGDVAKLSLPAADAVFVEIKKVGKYQNGTDGAQLTGTMALADISKDKPLALTFSYNGRGGQEKLQFSFSVSENGMLSLDKQGQTALREIRDCKKGKNLALTKAQLQDKIDTADKAGAKATKVQTDLANKSDIQLWKIGIAEGMDDKLEIEYRVFMKLDGEDIDLVKTVGSAKDSKAKGSRGKKSRKNDDDE